MAWSFRIAPAVQAIATSPMNCEAGHLQLSYHDKHIGVPVSYFWHSTVRGHSYNRSYTLWGSCTFKVNVNGKPGSAVLNFRFNYSIVRSATDPVSIDVLPLTSEDSNAEAFESELDIILDQV